MALSGKMEEVIPFALMVTMEGCTVGLTILAKTAMNRGISPFVLVVYTNTLASIILVPYSFLFQRDRTETEQPLFTLPLLVRFFFLGLTGIAIAQNCAFMGLYYSSPIVVCVMGLMIPAVCFLLSLILRTTTLDWKSSSIRVKVLGTLISIMGAAAVEIYKGPFIRKASFSQLQAQKPPLFVFYSTPNRWVLGGILLAASSLSVCVWNIIQAIFGSIIRTSVHVVCTHMKGPFCVPMFKPFGIVFATAFGVSFFTNALHYGSLIGAVIAAMGYYTVMWGQIREDELRKLKTIQRVESSDEKVPLLQQENEV